MKKSFFQNSEISSASYRVDEDTSIVYLLDRSSLNADIDISIDVSNSATLDLTVVDLSSSDVDFKLKVNLNRYTTALINLVSVNPSSIKKVFKIDTNHIEGDTYSRCKMGGINVKDGLLQFLGSSYIKNGSHNSDTRQEGKITNLSPLSRSEVSPSLLIKDKDIKASHGASLGAYSQDQIFYLMSRGLSEEESKRLITLGTILPLLSSLDKKLQDKCKEALKEILR